MNYNKTDSFCVSGLIVISLIFSIFYVFTVNVCGNLHLLCQKFKAKKME